MWHRRVGRRGSEARCNVRELDVVAAKLYIAWRKKVGDNGNLRWGQMQLLLRWMRLLLRWGRRRDLRKKVGDDSFGSRGKGVSMFDCLW